SVHFRGSVTRGNTNLDQGAPRLQCGRVCGGVHGNRSSRLGPLGSVQRSRPSATEARHDSIGTRRRGRAPPRRRRPAAPPGRVALAACQLPGGDASFFSAFDTLPAFCRVQAIASPAAGSRIGLEVWLPAASWIGRYVGAGNGGQGGTINYYRLAEAVNAGYVGSSTDTGHRGAVHHGRQAATRFG